jgi:hypothetical protein
MPASKKPETGFNHRYTLLSVSAAHVVAPAVRANIGYDTLKDFASITMTTNAAY